MAVASGTGSSVRHRRRWVGIRHPRVLLIAIACVAALGRILYALAFRNDVFHEILLHDAARYWNWGQTLARGGVWEADVFQQAPLYPWLLGLLFRYVEESRSLVYAVQIGLGLLTIAAVHRLARRAYGDGPAIAAAGLAAFYQPFVFYETKILPATLAVFLSAVLVERLQAMEVTRRDIAALAPGLALGAATLTNAGFLLWLPTASAWLALDRNRTRARRTVRVALLVLGASLVVAPVSLRNRIVGGEWVLVSANGGITFWQGNNPGAVGVFSAPEGFTGSIADQRAESRRLASQLAGSPLSDADVSGFWFRRGLEFLVENPTQAVGLWTRKLVLAAADVEQPLEYDPVLDANPWRWLFPVPFALALGLATLRFVRREPLTRLESPLVLAIGVHLVLLLAFFVAGRYRLPAMPSLFAVAAGGAKLIVDRSRAGRGVMIPGILAGAVTVASMVLGPTLFADLRARQEAMSLCDRAGALRAEGYVEEAIDTYRLATRLDPSYPFAHLDLGKTLAETGRVDAAESEVREALACDAGLAEAWFDLGLLHHRDERLADAEAAFFRAWQLEPTNGKAANNVLGLRLRLRRVPEARSARARMAQLGLAVDPELERWLSDAVGSRDR